jgi:hypothetical protein
MYQGLWLIAPAFHPPIPDALGVRLQSAQHSLIAGFAELRFWSTGLHFGGAIGWGWWSPSFDEPPPDVQLDDAEGLALGISFGWKHRIAGVVDGDLAIEPWTSCFHAVPGLSQISLFPTLGFDPIVAAAIAAQIPIARHVECGRGWRNLRRAAMGAAIVISVALTATPF